MRITEAQCDAFARLERERFHRVLRDECFRGSSDTWKRGEEALTFIRTEVQSALRYGITDTVALALYVKASWKLHVSVDLYSPELREIAENRTLTPHHRATMLYARACSEGCDG